MRRTSSLFRVEAQVFRFRVESVLEESQEAQQRSAYKIWYNRRGCSTLVQLVIHKRIPAHEDICSLRGTVLRRFWVKMSEGF